MIKLTQLYLYGAVIVETPVYISAKHITSIEIDTGSDLQGCNSLINTVNLSYSVKETPKEILELLGSN